MTGAEPVGPEETGGGFDFPLSGVELPVAGQFAPAKAGADADKEIVPGDPVDEGNEAGSEDLRENRAEGLVR